MLAAQVHIRYGQGQDVLPKYLVKAFTDLEHAESFASGKLRFSTLGYYRQIEDRNRRDPNHVTAFVENLLFTCDQQ